MTTAQTLSPMMQQWHDLKAKQPDAILLFRLGDFYEAFYDDAKLLSDLLDITLTKRQDVPMSGMPYHSCANYLDKLLASGHKVAIAEQIENPKEVKGLVKRDIVKILTPGASFGAMAIDDKKHHFIALVAFKKDSFCLAWLDVSLNELYFQLIDDVQDVVNLINLISPKELIIHQEAAFFLEKKNHQLPSSILFKESFEFKHSHLEQLESMIKEHFVLHHISSVGLHHDASILACGKLIHMLKTDRLYDLKNINQLLSSHQSQYLMIDKSTQNHLEIFEKKEGKYQHLTLFNHLNHTLTSSGSRLFESWLKFPLVEVEKILERQQGALYFSRWEKLTPFSKTLKGMKDIQKILTKLNQNSAGPQDLKHLQKTLEGCQALLELQCNDFPSIIVSHYSKIHSFDNLIQLLDKALVDTPAAILGEGCTFKSGYNAELDELFALTHSQDEFLKDYEQKLKDSLGIKTLKVGSSKTFGFYIEISKGQAHLAPKEFVRRQTLTNQERFITDELDAFEKKSQAALFKLAQLEQSLFIALCQDVKSHAPRLLETAEALSHLDALQSLGKIGQKPGYCLPSISKNSELIIKKGRHPIVEELIGESNFMPNETTLDEHTAMMLITGPNMGGKSTYMRQVALALIMAQLGGFVPCDSMQFYPIEKLFTRIGASDDITSGQSTFMVEMAEAAYILKNATKNSVVILDEIGRGTSTYDGIAIAYAIAKYLMAHPKGAPKTLFATHYFELTDLPLEDSRIANFHAGVKDDKGKLIFLHQILKGAADKSYGIQVAKLAGLPEACIKQATHKLRLLLEPEFELFKPQNTWEEPKATMHPLLLELDSLNLNTITPLEALNMLSVWKKQYSI